MHALTGGLFGGLTIRDLDEILEEMERSPRIVGWGTGSVFDYFFRRHPLDLAYLVDNDASRWGDRRAGLPIFGPDRLRWEDPGAAIIVVYSGFWPEIVRQAGDLGFRRVVPASFLFAAAEDQALRARLRRLGEFEAREVVRKPAGTRAIVIQGPVVAGTTDCVVKATAVQHPHDLIVLSTWDDTPEEQVATAARFADEVVLTPRPANPGIQNRNLQIASTRAGLECARALGAKTALKIRSDLAVLNADVFDAAASLCASFPAHRARRYGLRGRLLVPAAFTRKYLLYHPSDLAMLGDIEDLLRYWAAPFDERSGELVQPERARASLSDLAAEGHPTETYLARHYCRAIGWPLAGDVADSWRCYRDLFAVVDHDWLDLVWFKNPAITDLRLRHGPRQLVDHRFWRSLASEKASAPSPEMDPRCLTLGDFCAATLTGDWRPGARPVPRRTAA